MRSNFNLGCVVWLYFAIVFDSTVIEGSAIIHFPLHGREYFPPITTPRSRRSTRQKSWRDTPDNRLLLVKRAKEKKGKEKDAKKSEEPDVLKEPQEVSFDSLGPIGKVVAATTELGVAVLVNYLQGYLTGFVAGTAFGMPGFMFRPVEKGMQQPFMAELKGRLARMNSRSVRFGKSFGDISAIFKGSDVAVRRMRHGKNDEWNDILGSAIAGAIFGRQEGPIGMLKGALLWGGMVYIINGGILGGSSSISRYTEEPVEEF